MVMKRRDLEEDNETHLFYVESCPDINKYPVGIGQVALDVERGCKWDEDGLGFCDGQRYISHASSHTPYQRSRRPVEWEYKNTRETHYQKTTTPTGRRAGTP